MTTIAVLPNRFRVFANPEAVARSWYPAVRSRRVGRGRIAATQLGGRRIVIYRDMDGLAHAIDARCPHLGADLSLGTVERDGVRCPFHGWCFGPDGQCRDAPGQRVPPMRRARAYPVDERWGYVWIFNGSSPLFALPSPEPDGRRWYTFSLPQQRIACHPHLVLANGLDLTHYERVHGMQFSASPRLHVSTHRVAVELRGRPQSQFWRALSGTRRREIVARFSTWGGSLAWTTVTEPVRFHVLFTGTPDRAGACVTRTIFLFPSSPRPEWLRALGLMAMLLHDDRRVLDTIEFTGHLDDSDAPLRAFAEVVDTLGAW